MTEIEKLARLLEPLREIRLAVLFGSAARGATRANSDIDLGVLLEDGADLMTLSVSIERAATRRVDLLALDKAPPLLRFEIARNGVVLLEREAGAWSAFCARAMIDWWDWAPTARIMHDTMIMRLREEVARGST